jgi:hypothetical protein
MLVRPNGLTLERHSLLDVRNEFTPASLALTEQQKYLAGVAVESSAASEFQAQLNVLNNFIESTTELTRQQAFLTGLTARSFIAPRYQELHEQYISDSIDKNVELVSGLLRDLKMSAGQNVWVKDPATQRQAPVRAFGFNRQLLSYVAKPNSESSWPMVDGIHLFLHP